MDMRDKAAEEGRSRFCIARIGLPDLPRFQQECFWKNSKPEMKTPRWFKNNPSQAELGVQNGVFLQRRWTP